MKINKGTIMYGLAIAAFAVFVFSLALVHAYSSPIYVANPDTKECGYYFAGEEDCFMDCTYECEVAGYNKKYCSSQCADPCHYNPKPENFTVDIGETANFSNQSEACSLWQECLNKKGSWNSTTLECGD